MAVVCDLHDTVAHHQSKNIGYCPDPCVSTCNVSSMTLAFHNCAMTHCLTCCLLVILCAVAMTAYYVSYNTSPLNIEMSYNSQHNDKKFIKLASFDHVKWLTPQDNVSNIDDLWR